MTRRPAARRARPARDLPVPGRRRRAGGARREPRARRGRDARAGGRVGLRQVLARRCAAAAAAEGHGGHGRGAARRRGRARDAARPAARRSLDGPGDRLPGRAPLAQPRAARGRPDRGGDPAALVRRGQGGHPGGRAARARGPARAARARLPAPALGRPAPARADRPGAGLRAAPPDRRRAHHGARRDGAGAGAAAARGPAGALRARDHLHHPRPLDARGRVLAHRRDVRRPDRGGGSEPRGVREGRASIHARARRGVPRDRRSRVQDESLRRRGRPAGPARAADGLPVPPALSREDRRLRVDAGRALGRRRGAPGRLRAREGSARVELERRAARGARPAHDLSPQGRRGARRRRGRPVDGGRRDPRARGRVRLRQDHARPRDHGPARARVRRGALPRRAAPLRARGAARAPPPRADDLPGPDRRAQRAPDDLRGGGRGRPDPGDRGRRGADRGRGSLERRAAAARELLHALPVRDLGWPAPARDHRRRDGARPRPARRRRAGVGPGRVGTRRDPGADAPDRAAGGRGHPCRDPRPRARVEHRRPGGGDVPRADRRGGPHRGDPARAEAPLHARAALGRARAAPDGAGDPRRARRPTRPASPTAAASTRAARSSSPARPSGSASSNAARGEDPRSLPACHAVAS